MSHQVKFLIEDESRFRAAALEPLYRFFPDINNSVWLASIPENAKIFVLIGSEFDRWRQLL